MHPGVKDQLNLCDVCDGCGPLECDPRGQSFTHPTLHALLPLRRGRTAIAMNSTRLTRHHQLWASVEGLVSDERRRLDCRCAQSMVARVLVVHADDVLVVPQQLLLDAPHTVGVTADVRRGDAVEREVGCTCARRLTHCSGCLHDSLAAENHVAEGGQAARQHQVGRILGYQRPQRSAVQIRQPVRRERRPRCVEDALGVVQVQIPPTVAHTVIEKHRGGRGLLLGVGEDVVLRHDVQATEPAALPLAGPPLDPVECEVLSLREVAAVLDVVPDAENGLEQPVADGLVVAYGAVWPGDLDPPVAVVQDVAVDRTILEIRRCELHRPLWCCECHRSAVVT
mmetsp:Transcript_44661/g.126209  ORF Transcript_44661/g.126209 Transcript_44661/m.126209 type:complete len:339 (+) Transcript_44661:1060-2076(+)